MVICGQQLDKGRLPLPEDEGLWLGFRVSLHLYAVKGDDGLYCNIMGTNSILLAVIIIMLHANLNTI